MLLEKEEWDEEDLALLDTRLSIQVKKLLGATVTEPELVPVCIEFFMNNLRIALRALREMDTIPEAVLASVVRIFNGDYACREMAATTTITIATSFPFVKRMLPPRRRRSRKQVVDVVI